MVRAVGAIIFSFALLHGEDYFVTYKLYTKDFRVYNESIQIAKAMTPRADKPYGFISLSTPYEKPGKFFAHQKRELLQKLLAHDAYLSSKTAVSALQARTDTTLRLYPKRIKVEFNNGLARIGLYK